jgi:hypothetical protein
MNNRWHIFVAVLAIVLAILACGGAAPRRGLNLYPSSTPNATQTPMIVTVESSPSVIVIEVTVTSEPAGKLCVNADVAVHLRPSPNNQNYPITVIANRTELIDLGGRNSKWMFVQIGDNQGWVHGDYVQRCN